MSNRYLVLTELFLPTKGGTAVWFDQVYRRLGGKGIHVITADVPGAADYDRDHPNSIHRVSLKRVWWLKPESLMMYLKFLFVALWLALTNRFDAIHAGRALPEGLIAWVVARLTFRPVVIYAHGEELTGWGKGNKYKVMCFALQHADQVIANSDFTRDTLIGMGVRQDRIVLIHPGVDTDFFRPDLHFQDLRDSLGLKPGAKLILSVGRLSRRKGFDKVIGSLPALVQAGMDVHYAIIGIGEDEAYLRRQTEGVGMIGRVHQLGHVAMEDLPRWYNACDVFVLANREIAGDTEGFGIVFLEAAACGKPAIAGRAGGTGSAVLEGITGLRIDGDSAPDLHQALCALLSDPARSAELGRAGLERVRTSLSWNAVAERTEQFASQKLRTER